MAALTSTQVASTRARRMAWQLLYRRDVVDRFRLLAILLVVGVAAGLLIGTVAVDDASPFSALTLPSIAAGVILTESRLRRG